MRRKTDIFRVLCDFTDLVNIVLFSLCSLNIHYLLLEFTYARGKSTYNVVKKKPLPLSTLLLQLGILNQDICTGRNLNLELMLNNEVFK